MLCLNFDSKRCLRCLLWLVFGAVLVSVMAGCGHGGSEKGGPMFRWTPVSAAFDSTVHRLERAYIYPTPQRLVDSLTNSLSQEKPVGDSQAQKLQTVYWQSRLLRRTSDEDSVRMMVEKTLEQTDSAAFPYEYSRLMSILASLRSTPPEQVYRMSARNLHYYEQTRDSFMLGATLMRLGGVMWSISDTVPAAAYYMRADSVYKSLGLKSYELRNLLNIANTLDRPSSHTQRDSLMTILLTSEIVRQDSSLYHLVLRNQYFNTGDFRYLRRAYNYLHDNPNYVAQRAAYEGEIADFFLGNDYPVDSVMRYARLAYADIDHVDNDYDRAAIYNVMAFTSYVRGDADRSLDFYREFLDARLNLEREHYSLETTKADYRSSYELRRQQEKLQHAHERVVWIVIFSVLILLIAFGGVAIYVKIQKIRIRRRESEIELQQSRNYLSACTLAIDEKDRLLSSIVNSVESLRDEGRIGGNEAKEITLHVRRSLGNTLERETFTELHKKLHPEFIRRLKTDYPSLTESQLKHAAYIAMGMSSKQIAQALNIEYASVKKSRTRLRQRMGLGPDCSLEDALRTYTLS